MNRELLDALNIIKDSDRCRGCIGQCSTCEYSQSLDKIEEALEVYCLINEALDAGYIKIENKEKNINEKD